MKNCNTNCRTLRIEPGLAGLTEEQLQVARSEGAKQKISLRESVLKLGLINETKLLTAMAEKSGLRFLNISAADIDSNAEVEAAIETSAVGKVINTAFPRTGTYLTQ